MRSYREAGWRGEEIGWSGARLFAPVSPPPTMKQRGGWVQQELGGWGSTLFLDT